MILLAFDVGRKKTGVAVGSFLTGGARPVAVVCGDAGDQIVAAAKYIREWAPQILVVGLPRYLDGGEHKMTRFCRTFAEKLRDQFRLPVEFADERLTTYCARTEAGKRDKIDAVAAEIILRDWIQSRQSRAAE